jgi:hypothetical protein
MSATLKWWRRRACVGHFICTRLSGHVCGDYAVGLVHSRLETSTGDVCYEKYLYDFTFQTGDSMNVTFWYVRGLTSFQANCFAWCSWDGEMPEAAGQDSSGQGYDDILQDVVSKIILVSSIRELP